MIKPSDIDISNFPHKPWVYFFKKSGRTLYIGKAKDLQNRLQDYFRPGSVWKQDMLAKANDIDYVLCQTDQEALILETNLIAKHKPRYNRLIRGNTSYVYIKIWNSDFPNIDFTRYKKQDWATYIWPKYYRNDLKKLLQLIRQIFKFRDCTKTQFQKGDLCSDYFFGICKWRCAYHKLNSLKRPAQREKILAQKWFQKKVSYKQAKKEYNEIITTIQNFFKWKTKPIQDLLLEKIDSAIKQENYKRAAIIKKTYKNISKFTQKQSVVLDQKITGWFCKIQTIGIYNVYVICNFYEGKLIDIVSDKVYKQERDFSQIISWLKLELEWDYQDYESTSKHKIWVFDVDDIDKIKKETRKTINQQLDRYIDSVISSSSFKKQNIMDELLKELKDKYNLDKYPYIIECIDISHLGGEYSAWGLSSMHWWVLSSKNYRRYKIQNESKSDDYANLKEVIKRRFKLNKNIDIKDMKLPDLFVIDGGKWQLNILKELIKKYPKFQEIYEQIDFVSIGKWKARQTKNKLAWEKEILYKFDTQFQIQYWKFEYDKSDQLLIKLRDQAHNFANKYREKLMSKELK